MQFTRVGALEAIVRLGNLLAGKPETGRGIAGTGPLPDGCPVSAPVTYRDGRPTPTDLLDAISRQSRSSGCSRFEKRPRAG